MSQQPYNLDESANEYFEFTVLGHSYLFRHPTTEELETLVGADKDPKKTMEVFTTFIQKAKPSSPEFIDIYKKMTARHVMNFRKMVESEFSVNAGI